MAGAEAEYYQFRLEAGDRDQPQISNKQPDRTGQHEHKFRSGKNREADRYERGFTIGGRGDETGRSTLEPRIFPNVTWLTQIHGALANIVQHPARRR